MILTESIISQTIHTPAVVKLLGIWNMKVGDFDVPRKKNIKRVDYGPDMPLVFSELKENGVCRACGESTEIHSILKECLLCIIKFTLKRIRRRT